MPSRPCAHSARCSVRYLWPYRPWALAAPRPFFREPKVPRRPPAVCGRRWPWQCQGQSSRDPWALRRVIGQPNMLQLTDRPPAEYAAAGGRPQYAEGLPCDVLVTLARRRFAVRGEPNKALLLFLSKQQVRAAGQAPRLGTQAAALTPRLGKPQYQRSAT